MAVINRFSTLNVHLLSNKSNNCNIFLTYTLSTMSKITEKLLLYKISTNKDPESFGLLYDLYVEKIYRFIYFKVGSKEVAEDITSEVFLKVWDHINKDKEIKSFSGLIYRLARNTIIDLYRSRAREPQILDIEESYNIADTNIKWFEQIDLKADVRSVAEALEKIKQEYKEVVTLRYIEELEIEEIAQIMDKKNVAVRVTLHRAVKKLKELLN